jgi:hypothetical protein
VSWKGTIDIEEVYLLLVFLGQEIAAIHDFKLLQAMAITSLGPEIEFLLFPQSVPFCPPLLILQISS